LKYYLSPLLYPFFLTFNPRHLGVSFLFIQKVQIRSKLFFVAYNLRIAKGIIEKIFLGQIFYKKCF